MVTRTLGLARTRYFHQYAIDREPIVAEYDDIGATFVRFYVYTPDGELLYSIESAILPTVHFYHADRNGNVLALTDGITGLVTDSYTYGPYGELLGRAGTLAQPFRWLGAWGVRTQPHQRSSGKPQRLYVRVANPTSGALNPGFDVTPAELITGIITPQGIFKPKDLWASRRKLGGL